MIRGGAGCSAIQACEQSDLLLLLGLDSIKRVIDTVVGTLYILDNLLHDLALLIPGFFAHLGLLVKQLLLGLAVAATQAVPKGEVLAVVVVEGQVVNTVAGSTVDDRVVGDILTIMDHDGPEVDKDKKEQICPLLKWEKDWENMVGKALQPTVNGVEGVRGVGRRHNPLVMRLVQMFVDARVMQATVNKVDKHIGKEEEEGELGNVVPAAGTLRGLFVHAAVALDLGKEEWRCQERHDGHSGVGLLNLQPDLVFEVLWVLHGLFIKNEGKGEGREHKVRQETKEPIGAFCEQIVGGEAGHDRDRLAGYSSPCNQKEGKELAKDVVTRHGGRICVNGWLQLKEKARWRVLPRRECLRRSGIQAGSLAKGHWVGRERSCVRVVEHVLVHQLQRDIHGGQRGRNGAR